MNSISVVICTKDRAEMLQNCLDSIQENSIFPKEIVVMDQSKNGKTAEVIAHSAVRSKIPITYKKIPPTGLACARNASIKISKGEILVFTDDDCIVDPQWIEAIEKEFSDKGVSCVCGHTLPADHKNRPKQAYISTLNHHARRQIKGKSNPITAGKGNNMAFRKDVLLNLGGFNEQIGVGTSICAGEDLDLIYRLLNAGGMIVNTPEAIVLHSQPKNCNDIVRKKQEYAVSAAAVLGSRARYGDIYAGLLLFAKICYEFGCLFCGGILRGNGLLIRIGWNSFKGSIIGLKYLRNPSFRSEIHRLYHFAKHI